MIVSKYMHSVPANTLCIKLCSYNYKYNSHILISITYYNIIVYGAPRDIVRRLVRATPEPSYGILH